MKMIDEILPKVKAEVRLDKDNKTLWIKTDTLDGYGRVIIEDGTNWCRIFYEDCGECAHNEAEQTEPQTEDKLHDYCKKRNCVWWSRSSTMCLAERNGLACKYKSGKE